MGDIYFESFIDLLNKSNDSDHNALEYLKVIGSNNDNQNDCLSFKNLNKISNYLSNHLLNIINQNNNNNNNNKIIIGVYQNHSFQLIISILSIFKLNLIYLPLDTTYPNDRLIYMLNHSDCNIIITTHNHHQNDNNKELFKNKKIICLDCLFNCEEINNKLVDKFLELNNNNNFEISKLNNGNNNNSNNNNIINDSAYLVYTSGSTGNPKGVLCSHRGIVPFLKHQIKSFKFKGEHTRLLQSLPICFDASLSEIGTSLLGGCTLLIPKTSNDAQLIRGSSISFLNHVTLNKITAAMISPSFLSLLSIDAFNANSSPLETFVIGGEKCPINVLKQWRKKLNIINVYGPTEVTVCTTTNLVYKIDDNNHDNDETTKDNINLLSLGDLVPGLSLYLLDQETKLPIKTIGSEGEIYISGDGVALGYFKNQIQTDQSFSLDPFINDGITRMFKTGDWGKLIGIDENGKESIEFRGRIDNQIKLNGSRIELDEISKTLENHHLVHQAICDVKLVGDNNKALIAYLIIKEKPLSCKLNNDITNVNDIELVKSFSTNSNLLSNILKEFLSKTLPKYMIPQYFIILKSFPLNKNEKIDKFQLPIPFIQQQQQQSNEQIDGEDDSNNNLILKSNLINIFKTILMNDSIESNQDLVLNYGMTSIQCMQIIELARSKFGIILTVFHIYNLKSIDNIILVLTSKDFKNEFGFKSIFDLKSFLLNFNTNQKITTTKNNKNNNNNNNKPLQSNYSNNILITGVTGFIGFNIFKNIINSNENEFKDSKFYLLVRNIEKINEILNKLNLKDSNRIIILKGDIGKINFDLNQLEYEKLCLNSNISTIIHCAAKVDMNLPFDEMIKDNIKSIYYLLDFINNLINNEKHGNFKFSKIHYISTLSTILSNSKYWKKEKTTNATLYNLNQSINCDSDDEIIYGGYAQSKWLSEYIISNLNLDEKLVIHRPAMICPTIVDKNDLTTTTTTTTSIYYSNYLNKLFDTCRKLNYYPLLPESIKTDITPIDEFVNNFIINYKKEISNPTPSVSGDSNIYSYFTANSESLLSLFKNEFGERGVDINSWLGMLNTNHSFYPFIQFLNDINSFEQILFPGNKLPTIENNNNKSFRI
ncbi:hypothetical protein ACTFIY_001378 [Dictyostelium cf. discoideum]